MEPKQHLFIAIIIIMLILTNSIMDWSSHFTGVEVRELWELAEVFYYAFNSMVGAWNIT
jgi:hypothetical protein